MKKKILFICNEGMSTSVLAQKTADYSKGKDIELEIDALPESQLIKHYKDYDYIMVAPQLGYMQNQIYERINKERKVGKISPIDFGRLNFENIYNSIIEELDV